MSEFSAPWILRDLASAGPDEQLDTSWLVERLSETPLEIQSHMVRSGLTLGSTSGQTAAFGNAAAAIDEIPDLANIVRARVRHIHILMAPPEYDVSHSEPRWADRIFVSVPECFDCVGALRLAENVIHEAMHLHLTLFERETPLVRNLAGEIQSPWRHAPRPFGGVLHGLFVFASIQEYFARLSLDRDAAAARHICRRLEEIKTDIAQVDIKHLNAGLTEPGQRLAAILVKQPLRERPPR